MLSKKGSRPTPKFSPPCWWILLCHFRQRGIVRFQEEPWLGCSIESSSKRTWWKKSMREKSLLGIFYNHMTFFSIPIRFKFLDNETYIFKRKLVVLLSWNKNDNSSLLLCCFSNKFISNFIHYFSTHMYTPNSDSWLKDVKFNYH